jgi:hypothetical protein
MANHLALVPLSPLIVYCTTLNVDNMATVATVGKLHGTMLHHPVFQSEFINHNLLTLIRWSELLSVDMFEISMPDKLTTWQLEFTRWHKLNRLDVQLVKRFLSCFSQFLLLAHYESRYIRASLRV